MAYDGETVTATELAGWLGITQPAISQARWAVKAPSGGYFLKASVLAYAKMARSRRGIAETPADDLDEELTRWKIQTEKRKDSEWRQGKLREMCDAILVILRDDCARVRDAIAARPDAAEIVALLDQVRADVDGIEADDVVRAGDED